MLVGRFGISKDKITRGKKVHNTHLTATTCREVTQRLKSTICEWGLGREAQATSSVLRARTRLA